MAVERIGVREGDSGPIGVGAGHDELDERRASGITNGQRGAS